MKRPTAEQVEREIVALDTLAMTYKIEWERELERRQRLGITDLPDPLPHPDHIVINMRDGTVRVTGPATKEEKAPWDLIKGRRHEFEEELRELEELAKDPDYPHRQFVLQDLKHTKKILAIIEAAEARWLN